LGTWGTGWVIDANVLRTTNKSKKSNTPHHPQKKKKPEHLGVHAGSPHLLARIFMLTKVIHHFCLG
jgi:hypothetical protein